MIGSFFAVDQRIPFPGLLLVSRVNEITPVGTAYPLYGIVSSDVYPKQLLREKDALQRHLNTLTGIALPQKENAEHSFNMILLGKEAALKQNALSEKELEKQGFNGFTIAVKCSNLVIAGESIQGTAYGVYRFLETQGMKFFVRAFIRSRENEHSECGPCGGPSVFQRETGARQMVRLRR